MPRRISTVGGLLRDMRELACEHPDTQRYVDSDSDAEMKVVGLV
jgi:hypothetical protein